MRVMVIVKANNESESGVMPTLEMLADMGKYNEELTKAGVMLSGDGLKASSHGKCVKFGGKQPAVTDGPFAETKELIAGFWIWKVNSMEEALDWIKKAPFKDEEIEIRPFFENEDFGPEAAPQLQEYEERLRRLKK